MSAEREWATAESASALTEVRARLAAINRHRPGREVLFAEVRQVVVVASSSRGGSSIFTEILRRSPQGLRLAKIAMNTATDSLYRSTNHGMELMALNHVYGPEPQEGIASFQEKRPADWRRFREGQGPAPEAGA